VNFQQLMDEFSLSLV